MKINLTIGISDFPLDLLIFDACIHQKISSDRFLTDIQIQDTFHCNRLTDNKHFDVCRMSVSAYPYFSEFYQILESGNIIGSDLGPWLIGDKELTRHEINRTEIIIPDRCSSAATLLKDTYRQALKIKYLELPEKKINAVNQASLYVLEDRLRLNKKEKSYIKLNDLGQYWENSTWLLIPVYCMLVKRNLDEDLKTEVNKFLQASIQYAIENKSEVIQSVLQTKKSFSEEKLSQYFDIYFNDNTKILDDKARTSILRLLNRTIELESLGDLVEPIWIKNK